MTVTTRQDGGRLQTRPPVKQQQIIRHLRSQIVSGDLPPGARLPTRLEIEKAFAVSSVTVERAMARLIDDGFAISRGRHGTFVGPRLPHLHRYGVVFVNEPGDDCWGPFCDILSREAPICARRQGRECQLFYNVNEKQAGHDYHELIRQLDGQRLAGLVLSIGAIYLQPTPILRMCTDGAVPMIGTSRVETVNFVKLDRAGFLDRALAYFRQRGRRRIAVLCRPGQGSATADDVVYREAFARHELIFDPKLFQLCVGMYTRNLVQLLFALPAAERPDGLLITDDSLVKGAAEGLVGSGVDVPKAAEVVAFANFPRPTPSVLPFTRLGFDITAFLDLCFESIDHIRAGGAAPVKPLRLPAVFEHEITASIKTLGESVR